MKLTASPCGPRGFALEALPAVRRPAAAVASLGASLAVAEEEAEVHAAQMAEAAEADLQAEAPQMQAEAAGEPVEPAEMAAARLVARLQGSLRIARSRNRRLHRQVRRLEQLVGYLREPRESSACSLGGCLVCKGSSWCPSKCGGRAGRRRCQSLFLWDSSWLFFLYVLGCFDLVGDDLLFPFVFPRSG